MLASVFVIVSVPMDIWVELWDVIVIVDDIVGVAVTVDGISVSLTMTVSVLTKWKYENEEKKNIIIFCF